MDEVLRSGLPKPLTVFDETGERVVQVLEPSGITVVGDGECLVRLSNRFGMPKYGSGYELRAFDAEGHEVAMPEVEPGVFWVAGLGLSSALRSDLLVPGPAVVRNGVKVGCKGLVVPHHPAARRKLGVLRPSDLAGLIDPTKSSSLWHDMNPVEIAQMAFDMGLISVAELEVGRNAAFGLWTREETD